MTDHPTGDGMTYTSVQQDQIRQHLPSDWYRMHPSAQAHYWQQTTAELGITPN